MKQLITATLALALLSGCSGMRTTDTTFSTHAENFNLLYMQFPGGDTQQRAVELMPEGAQITTLISNPHDNTSFIGVFSRIIGFEYTSINGQISK